MGVRDVAKQDPEVTKGLRRFVLALWKVFSSPLRMIRLLFSSNIGSPTSTLEKVDVNHEESSASKEQNSDELLTDVRTESSIKDAISNVNSSVGVPLAASTDGNSSSEPDGTALVLNVGDIEITKTPSSSKEILSKDFEERATSISDRNSMASRPTFAIKPKDGDRWATAAVDMSGEWQLMDTEEFKTEYDIYLKQLGQPKIVRVVAVSIVGLTSERTEQTKEGREFFIRGKNSFGVWERCLVASGADAKSEGYERINVDVRTVDDETVQAETWWSDNGTVHRSWMRGVTKYGGGDFESKRYLEDGGKVMVCETFFHPYQEGRDKARLTWKFLRK